MTRIKGALFDKDGTLIDFAATWRGLIESVIDDYARSDRRVAAALGAAVGYDAATGVFVAGSPVVSDSAETVARLMAEVLGTANPAEIENDLNRRAARAGAGDSEVTIAPVEGLAEALDALRAHGVRLGVATHDSEAAARAHVGALKVGDRFDFVAGYDSGHGLKPGPGMPAAFCAAMGFAASDVVMVGDSVHDLGAGRSAGCAAAVAVLSGPATEAELTPYADVVLPSVADLPDYLRRNFPA